MVVPAESDLTLNVVWTGSTFDHLYPFVRSQMEHSTCRFRFVANGCPPDAVSTLRSFQAQHPHRIIEVLVVFEEMLTHGQALDAVLRQRDDGDHFCFIDPDIKANGSFLTDLATLLQDHEIVSSGTEVWSETNLLPAHYHGIAGEYFYDQDGFVFGCPHLALYDRSSLDATMARYDVGLGSAGPELNAEAQAAMDSIRPGFRIFDTAKIVNILMQVDDARIIHRDLPQLVHIGGLSHYLSPSGYRVDENGERAPEWTRWDNMSERHEVTRYAARLLWALEKGDDVPEFPDGLSPSMAERLQIVRRELTDLVARHPRV